MPKSIRANADDFLFRSKASPSGKRLDRQLRGCWGCWQHSLKEILHQPFARHYANDSRLLVRAAGLLWSERLHDKPEIVAEEQRDE